MRTFTNRYWILLLALVVSLAVAIACGDDDDADDDDDDDTYGDDDDYTGGGDYDDWINALPDPDTLELTLPGSEIVPQTLGEIAKYYIETVQMTRNTNDEMLAFLSIIDEIFSYDPTTVDGDTATWGPVDGTGLEATDWRFTMTKLGENQFTYTADWRPKNSDDDADFVAIWEGEVTDADTTQRRGIGSYTLHFTVAKGLDPTVEGTGDITVVYDTLTAGRNIQLQYADWLPDDLFEPVNGTYDYAEHADGSGDFLFDVWADIHFEDWGDQLPDAEHMWFFTRWQADGVGRCDVSITDGEIPDMHELFPDEVPFDLERLNVSECWDDGFGRVYFGEEIVTDTGNTYPIGSTMEGDEAACGFTRQLPVID